MKQKKIIVTGSEGLLGKEISKHLEKNHKILRLDLKHGDDLSNEKFVKNWFSKNSADCLVNCFALNDDVNKKRKGSTFFEYSLDSFRNYLEVNLISLFSVCREFAKYNKKGTIINFSSIYGIQSPRNDLYDNFHKEIGYGVSKAGVVNMTKYLAVHLAPNFSVNCVVPGGVLGTQNSKFIKNYSKLTPHMRMMKKNELNELIEFLCTSKSNYMTGSTIVVDGGYSIW